MEETNLTNKKNSKKIYIIAVALVLILCTFIGVTSAFFSYVRTGNVNSLTTATIIFNYQDGSNLNISNQYPINWNKVNENDSNKLTFSVTAHNTVTNGVSFNVYAIYGDEEIGKSRLLDSTMKMKFVAPSDGNGFSITTNNFSNPTSPVFTNNEVLIATGLVQGTSGSTTKNYSLYMWLDDGLAYASSTTKRTNNAEGNPSLADATTGNVENVTRYMKNSNVSSSVTLYPAKTEAQGKIIYTTNELHNSYYSIKLKIVATGL